MSVAKEGCWGYPPGLPGAGSPGASLLIQPGRDAPTAGFAIGFDRTIIALEAEKYDFDKPKIDVYIIPVNEEMIEKSIEIAQILRSENFIVEFDLLSRGIGKSLKYANSKNAKKVIIIGPDELATDSVTLRNMQTGDQNLIKISDIISLYVHKKFGIEKDLPDKYVDRVVKYYSEKISAIKII